MSTFSDKNNYILSTFAMGYPGGSSYPDQSTFALVYTRASDKYTRAYLAGPAQVAFYPSVAMAQSTANGDLAIWGFGTATTSAYPNGNFLDFNLDTDSFEQPNAYLYWQGNTYVNPASGGGNRWGDYSSTVPDYLDTTSVFTAQQYYDPPPGGSGPWYNAAVVGVRP